MPAASKSWPTLSKRRCILLVWPGTGEAVELLGDSLLLPIELCMRELG